MDHQALAQLLGNYGEFVGAIAVVATLIYLTVQVRQGKEALNANTAALADARRVAIAQNYQNRVQLQQDHLQNVENSAHVPEIINKFFAEGIDALNDVERTRFRYGILTIMNQLDNMHFQYSLELLDEEVYEYDFKHGVRRQAPTWDLLEISPRRPSFAEAVKRILEEDRQRVGE